MLKIKHKWLPLLLLTTAGCAQGPQLAKTNNNLSEASRKLTTAVVDTLQLQPTEQRDVYSTTALQLAEQDQRIEGWAPDPINVPVLLGIGSTTEGEQKAEQRALEQEFARITALLKKKESLENQLLNKGVAAEVTQSRKVKFWAKAAGLLTFPIGAVIALFVFLPASIPLFGRLLGWVVAKIPSLAGSVGVVSVKAFDAVVKGIEKTRKTIPEKTSGVAPTVSTSTFGNEESGDSRRRTGELFFQEWFGALESNLARGMDRAHKTLVQQRKLALGND